MELRGIARVLDGISAALPKCRQPSATGSSDLAAPADGQEAFFIELSGGIFKNR